MSSLLRSTGKSQLHFNRTLTFSHKAVGRTEIIIAKNLIFKTEDNVPAGKL
jgi:hypothetical protein